MREITQEEIDRKLKAHKLWIYTNNIQGEQAHFTDVVIESKNFFRGNLCRAVFENVECVDTVFDWAKLNGAEFKNVHFYRVSLSDADLQSSSFRQCNIANTTCQFANLKNSKFQDSALINVDFTYCNLYDTDFSTANVKSPSVYQAVPIGIRGQKVICVQMNTSRQNSLISYWSGLGIWTTGCFQGTLKGLRKMLAEKHKDNPVLRARYERAIKYILEEDKAYKEKEST